MTRRGAAILLAALVAAVGVLLFVSRPNPSLGRRRSRLFLRVTPAPAPATPAAGVEGPTPAPTVRVTLFFLGADDGKLHSEERDIPKPAGAGAYLKALFAELKRGPQRQGLLPSIPQRIQLRNAFLLPQGLVVVDLAIDAGLAFGSDEELSIVASLVDTILQNVADTNRVGILVNGEPAETLGGHVDLTRPLLYLRDEVAP
jgi:sporulation and spore germination protein